MDIKLPILDHQNEILDSIKKNAITIISGETGSGKSTQVPQILLESFQNMTNKNNRIIRIAVTEPRRMAAIMLARRVQTELENRCKSNSNSLMNNSEFCKKSVQLNGSDQDLNSEKLHPTTYVGGTVGYSVRFQKKVSRETQITFITTGMILREAIVDPLLKKYSIIIVDEAHERSVPSDIFLGFLKLLLLKRKHLRIIVMSATLDTCCFSNFFTSSSIIKVQGRQWPVSVNFISEEKDYFQYLINTIIYIHLTKINEKGDILVFLPGQDEIAFCQIILEQKKSKINLICKDLAEWCHFINMIKTDLKSPNLWSEFVKGSWMNKDISNCISKSFAKWLDSISEKQLTMLMKLHKTILNMCPREGVRHLEQSQNFLNLSLDQLGDIALIYNLTAPLNTTADKISNEVNCQSTKYYLSDHNLQDIYINNKYQIVINCQNTQSLELLPELKIFPLFSALSDDNQELVLKPTGPNTRKVILATNIAETSLTIPGIRYIVDSGYHKVKHFDPKSGIFTLKTEFISQANAKQRCGRAGRVESGECYRMYTEQQYESMKGLNDPEILKSDLAQTVLELKALNVQDIMNFPFITLPSVTALNSALDTLKKYIDFNENEIQCDYRLKALDSSGNIIELGKKMVAFPVTPEHSYFLLNSIEFDCTAEVLTIVAMMNTENIWILDNKYSNHTKQLKSSYDSNNIANFIPQTRRKIFCTYGDHLTLLNVYLTWEECQESRVEFCKIYGLNNKSLYKAKNIRQQLKDILINTIGVKSISSCLIGKNIDSHVNNPSSEEFISLRKCILKSFSWNLAVIQSIHFNKDSKSTSHNMMPYTLEKCRTTSYIHPHSVLTCLPEKPKYLIYTELVETNKLYIRLATSVELEWLTDSVYSRLSSQSLDQYNKMEINDVIQNKFHLDKIRTNDSNSKMLLHNTFSHKISTHVNDNIIHNNNRHINKRSQHSSWLVEKLFKTN